MAVRDVLKTWAAVVGCLLAGCAAPAAPGSEGAMLIETERDATCFTVERTTPPAGGLAIARQRVCGPVAPRRSVTD